MSTETKTDREMLAEVAHLADCGPECHAGIGPVHERIADAILASDWLRERDGGQRLLGAIRISGDYDEAGAFEAGMTAVFVALKLDETHWRNEVAFTNPYAETSAE